ncbi:MAG: cephalosporin hydroxylase family protein [Gammaproteobacteria bacterium]|nr:cephalosporin hydroxylase family protein [Gammaproteobacteria bacterium]
MTEFEQDLEDKLSNEYSQDNELKNAFSHALHHGSRTNYTYNFFWLGRPIIQLPQDIQSLQEIIWQVKPDLIIETGIAHGGSLIFSSSMLCLLEDANLIEKGDVLGIDIDIRKHNKKAIIEHPLSKRITMIEGSSVDTEIIDQVHKFAENKSNILVMLDSNHTHEHVLAELQAYAPLVSVNSYCVVADTYIEDADQKLVDNRPWGKGNGPKTAVYDYLAENSDFRIDRFYENKALMTSCPDGFLKRIK